MIKLRSLLISVGLFFALGNINARSSGDLIKLNQDIELAKTKFSVAVRELRRLEPELFDIFENNLYMGNRHLAEIEMRDRFQSEYYEYIQTRMDLDGLVYLQYLTIIDKTHKL